MFIRKSLELTGAQWSELDRLAAETESAAQAGPTYGEPSWRTMVKRIANREITLREVEAMHIEVEFSPDSLWGDTDPGNYDWEASESRYAEMLQERLRAEYPNAQIEVTKSINDRVRVDGFSDHEDVPWIEDAIGKTWSEFEWTVE